MIGPDAPQLRIHGQAPPDPSPASASGIDGRSRVRTIVKGRNIDVPQRLREYAERKLDRIERLLGEPPGSDDRSQAVLELSIQHHRSGDDSHVAEMTLVIDGQTVRSHAAGATHQAAIDLLTDKVERQTVTHKEKPRQHARPIEERDLLTRLADGTADTGRERRIVKTKRFAIEPMFEEDAVTRMEELGHDFFLFVNAEDERLALLYRRHDGDYGLIEPALGGSYATGLAGNRQARGASR
jgi:putative sigma-54 modulation protein